MPRVRIEQNTIRGPLAGYGVQVFLDDVEVKDLRSLTIQAHVDEVVTAHLEVLPTESWTFTHNDARVVVNVRTVPGMRIVVEPHEEGGIIYYAVPE